MSLRVLCSTLRRLQHALFVSLCARSFSGWGRRTITFWAPYACGCIHAHCLDAVNTCGTMELRSATTAIRMRRYFRPFGLPIYSHDHYNLSLFNLSITPHNTTSTPTMTHRERISSGALMEFGVHRVDTHVRGKDLSVVYTIDPAVVEDSINTVE